jgi:hypothetical protein
MQCHVVWEIGSSVSEKQVAYSLKMEAAVVYEMLVPVYKTVCCHISEDLIHCTDVLENVNSNFILSGCGFACYYDHNCACHMFLWQKSRHNITNQFRS